MPGGLSPVSSGSTTEASPLMALFELCSSLLHEWTAWLSRPLPQPRHRLNEKPLLPYWGENQPCVWVWVLGWERNSLCKELKAEWILTCAYALVHSESWKMRLKPEICFPML